MSESKQEEMNIKMAKLIKTAFEELQTPFYLEKKRLFAQEKMLLYKSYLAAGFTETQAIELCRGPL